MPESTQEIAMRKMIFASAVLYCSVVSAAPPEVEPELATWWDAWHNADRTFNFPVERSVSTGRRIPYSYIPYENNSRRQLYDIMVDPTSSAAARRQAYAIYGHWSLWRRGQSTEISVP